MAFVVMGIVSVFFHPQTHDPLSVGNDTSNRLKGAPTASHPPESKVAP